ncbi:MAG: ATP synthase F1 subunit delta [Candidatus Nealsonbacteria bacterium]|nr:ATP synthase F1 subunit delta [Candidatus Nealsonbacteria bacterium]
MKITPLQYAIFLYEITLKTTDIKKKVKGFLEFLARNNDLGKINKIIKEFEIYERKQKGIKEVEVISIKPLAASVKRQIAESIKNGGEIKETVNPDLVGGLTVIIGDTMIDGSLRRKLRELNKALSYG